MPRKSCCCGGGNYIAVPCRYWSNIVFSGYNGFTGIEGASAIQGYDEYFGETATALFKRSDSIFGLSGPLSGFHPFFKFPAGIDSSPVKVVGFTGCLPPSPVGPISGGYNGTTCYELIYEIDNSRPVYYKLWGAGGGGVSTPLNGGNGAFTQVNGVYNQNNIACVGFGGFGNNMVKNFTGWTGILPTYSGGGGQGFPAWGGGAAFVSSSFSAENNVAIVGAGGGAGTQIAGPGHGGATYGKDATPTEGGKGACGDTPGKGGCGAESGIMQSGGRGHTGNLNGGGGGGGGLAGGGGGGKTGFAGGGGSSEVTEWARSGNDQGPPNICDPYYWHQRAGSYLSSVMAGFGAYVKNPNSSVSYGLNNNSEFGMAGKVVVLYSGARCVCDSSLDTLPEQTYICLNQNQYNSIMEQARGSSACYGSSIEFGGATGLCGYGGFTFEFLKWDSGEGGEIPKFISFYYENELYYLIGQCPVLCDPAYQVPEDASITLSDCRDYGGCCKARLATPYCKIPTAPGVDCFDISNQCPSDCIPETKPSPFYVCDTNEENVGMPDGIFWTKKNGYYYMVTPTQGWIPFGQQIYPTEIISDIILGEPCCNDNQQGCSGGIDTNTPSSCCKVVNEPFPYPHPGRASITAIISFNGNPEIPESGDCSTYPGCCRNPTPYNSVLDAGDIRCGEPKSFPPKSSFSGFDCDVENSDCSDPFEQKLSYSIYYPSNDENPYVPVFRIESYCSCLAISMLPDLAINGYYEYQYNCEIDFVNTGKPAVIVQSGGIDDIVSALQSVSGGKYTVTKLSSQKFWFGVRHIGSSCIIPGDDYMVEDTFPDDPNGGYRHVRTYYARSPHAGVSIGTCGSLIDNCGCQYRVMPVFVQSIGIPDETANPGCRVKPSSKTLVEWSENPNTTPLLTDGGGCPSGQVGTDVYLCSGFYASCSPGFWAGTSCSFTAKSEI